MRIDLHARLKLLEGMFGNKRFALSAAILFVLLLSAYFVLSGTFVISLMQFNPAAEMPLVVLQMAIALLAAIQLAIVINFNGKRKGMTGGIIALFISACPVCVPIWLYALGLGSALAFLADFSLALGLICVAVLAYSLWRCLDPECKVIKYEKGVQG